MAASTTTSGALPDVVVVGAGILGLAVARELLARRPGIRLLVLEKEPRIAQHQTGHNSGVVHSGIYYAPGSLKAKLCVSGARRIYELCAERGIPVDVCGKVIVAVDEHDLPRLTELDRRGVENRVEGAELVDEARLRELEPHVAGLQALHVPSTGIVDFRRVAAALAEDVRQAGGEIRTGAAVTALDAGARDVAISTENGSVTTGFLVTCAGLQSDRLARMTGAPESPKIVPFRGSYYVLHPDARRLVRSLVYPVPDPSFPFLGVHFTKHVSGDVWAGPNAVLAGSREGYRRRDIRLRDLSETLSYSGFRALARRYWRTGLTELHGELSKRAFVRALQRLVPELELRHVRPGPSGVRAQALAEDGTLVDDFWLDEDERITHVRNAPSPGATSSLALAGWIADRLDRAFG